MASPTTYFQPSTHKRVQFLKQNMRIVFEGDSLTRRSIGASLNNWPLLRINQWDRSYAEIVEEWLFVNLPELSINAQHSAVGGSTINMMKERYATQVKTYQADWIVFTLGGNDSKPHHHISINGFREKLSAYIQQAEADNGTRFLFVGSMRPYPGLSDAERSDREKAQPYYDAAREVVIAHGGIAPDIGTALRRKAEALYEQSPDFHCVYADGSHFNALGNQLMANLVLQAMGAYDMLPLLEFELKN